MLPASGRALKLELAGATEQASVPGNGDTPSTPAIASRAYGTGRALLFGFDLVASVQAEPAWRGMLDRALAWLTPEAGNGELTPGTSVLFSINVTNRSKAVEVEVKFTLPGDAAPIESRPQALVAEGKLTWLFPLAPDARQELDVLFAAPTQAGVYDLTTVVSTIKSGLAKHYGNPLAQPLQVSGAVQILADASTGLSALNLSAAGDNKARSDALAWLQTAQGTFTAAQYEAAIHALVQAIEALRLIQGADTQAIRTGIDRALQESEWRWVRAQPQP